MTTPMAVTADAIACPDGYEAAEVAISGAGGRGRSTTALIGPIINSLIVRVTTHAVSASQRRRHAMTIVIAARAGHSTAVANAVLSTLDTLTSGDQRPATIHRYHVSS